MKQEYKRDSGEDVLSSKAHINDADFVYLGKRIFKEQSFETKPTSFLKDALHRFAKNKSSLSAFVIIGVLMLMALIVPLADTNDIQSTDNELAFLTPKWHGFENAGFLDGGENKTGILVLKSTGLPDGIDDVDEQVIGKIKTYRSAVSQANENAYGGNIIVSPSNKGEDASFLSPSFSFDPANDYSFSFGILGEPTSTVYEPGEFSVSFVTDEGAEAVLVPANEDYLDNGGDDNTYDYTVSQATFAQAVPLEDEEPEEELELEFTLPLLGLLLHAIRTPPVEGKVKTYNANLFFLNILSSFCLYGP